MTEMIVILGPTATGKTRLAVSIANLLNGEIISADSRQIYRGMDIGTGKDLEEYLVNKRMIPYHLIDILDPSMDYSVYQFQQDFHKSFNSITEKNKIPILCGGTGLYIESVLLDYQMAEVVPDDELRERLKRESHSSLIEKLKCLNPRLHNLTDLSTKKRTIRGIEIAMAEKREKGERSKEKGNRINYCILGINPGRDSVKKRITERLKFRLENGMIEETEKLIDGGLSLERLNYFGLEYKFIGKYLAGELNQNDLLQKLNSAIHRFAKRQMTFFRRMEKRGIEINWLDSPDTQQTLNIIHQCSE